MKKWRVKAVNYILKRQVVQFIMGADSHFSNYFAKHGKVSRLMWLCNYGDSLIGIQVR